MYKMQGRKWFQHQIHLSPQKEHRKNENSFLGFFLDTLFMVALKKNQKHHCNNRNSLKVTMNKKKIPIPLTTLTFAATMASSLMVADVANGDSSGVNSYHYWNDHLGSSYEDTSPNLANLMTSPGVAAALFFSTAGVSFSPQQHSI